MKTSPGPLATPSEPSKKAARAICTELGISPHVSVLPIATSIDAHVRLSYLLDVLHDIAFKPQGDPEATPSQVLDMITGKARIALTAVGGGA